MGLPQNPSTPPPHLYPQALQLKLYQAFIFSIPVLFSVILILLFYLFYLKRRASILSSSAPPILPTTSNQASPYIPSMGWNVDIRGKLPIVLFDEELKINDTQCCVCLGEFEIKEELLQVPSCKHVFHVDCLNNWLQSNRTCPLCRCYIIPITKLHIPPPPPTTTVSESQQQDHNTNSNQNQQQNISSLEHHRQLDDDGSSNADSFCREQLTIPIEGSSSESNA
ncbi:hypothetical protein Dsin_007969 [Dipteronia sinensis]|uniref:RING-type E3 ubiquitin transferase n=1 Tax=Dipteronia sinensis TaxID=43782 RepID=A0AAE0B1J0_9ROSI|nr:hypothetical protein Dsin_007969 [Dipteronia sinensis]